MLESVLVTLANYALVDGALPEAGLRSLAAAVHAQVEAFDGR
jgi:hypothetical protein